MRIITRDGIEDREDVDNYEVIEEEVFTEYCNGCDGAFSSDTIENGLCRLCRKELNV